jgi:hypothetical protein
MTVDEYEERFRSPAPSWHQILKLNQSRNRRRCCLADAGLIAVGDAHNGDRGASRCSPSPWTGSARGPAFDTLPGEFRRILD